MSLATIAINGVPLEDSGATLQSIDGFANTSQRTYQTVAPPIAIGGRFVSPGSSVAAGSMTLALLLRPSSLADRQAKIDAFVAQFAGLIEVSKIDAPSRVLYGMLASLTVAQPPNVAAHPFVRPESVATATLTFPDPRWFDRDAVITNVAAGSLVALPMGTAGVQRTEITLFGSTSNPTTISLCDQTGAAVQTMVLTGALGATEWLTIVSDPGNEFSIIRGDGTDLIQAGWFTQPQTFIMPRPPMLPFIESSSGALRVVHTRTWW